MNLTRLAFAAVLLTLCPSCLVTLTKTELKDLGSAALGGALRGAVTGAASEYVAIESRKAAAGAKTVRPVQ